MTQSPVNEREAPVRLSFGVLGPVVAHSEERALVLGGTKQRALLAMLLLDSGRPVSIDRIVDGLWADDPPATAQKMVQLYVSRLRKQLGPEVIRTASSGYEIDLRDAQLDLRRFRELVDRARASASVDLPAAARALHEALDLWRGEALADVAAEPFARSATASLEELRLATLEERIDADLALGRHADLVPELEGLVASNPLRERFRAQLMLALYRSGRQADALDAYRKGRTELVALGLDPSPSLQRLEVRMLQQDPELELPSAPVIMPPRESPVTFADSPARTPRRRGSLVAVLAVLAALACTVLVVVVATRHGAPAVSVAADSVAAIDVGSGRVVADVRAGGDPGALAVGAGSVWAGSRDDRTLVRIDPRTAKIEQTYGLAYAPSRIAVARSTVAVANGYSGSISTVQSRFSFISAPKRLRGPTRGSVAMAGGGGELWLGFQDGSVGAFDPGTLKERSSVSGVGQPGEMVYARGRLWMTQILRADLTRFWGRPLRVVGHTHIEGGAPLIAYGAGSVWVVSTSSDRLWRVDARSGEILSSIAVGASPSALAADGAHVWVGSLAGDVYVVDPAQGRLDHSFRLGHPVLALAATRGRLWAAVGA